jgi:putative hydroxymethylpyrimidine transport system substrate-binding protein
MTRRLLAALAALALTAGLTACGSKDDDATGSVPTQRVSLVLDYLPNPDHVGIYAAQARGDFRRAGLDVQIQTPTDPTTPLKLVEAGRADLAISYEPEVLLARDKGAHVVAAAAIANRPLTSLMSIGSSKRAVRSAQDLEGKTVGTAGIPYQSAYLQTILKAQGIDPSTVKQVDVGFDLIPAMVSKKVDATLGAFWNVEGVQLARRHKHPNIIHMEDVGVPTYDELVLVARDTFLHDHGALVRRFIQALQAGTRAVQADPSVGVDPLLKAAKGLDRGFALASVKATLPALLPERGKAFGYMDSGAWHRYASWMLEHRLLTKPANDAALTNEFLPGEGVQSSGDSGGSGL